MAPTSSEPSCIGIDAVRGLAAVVVRVTHAGASSFVGYRALPIESKGRHFGAIYALTRLGHEAVIVFFVLSGFLVTGRAMELAANGRFRLADFMFDRAIQILMAMGVACLFTAIVFLLNEVNFTRRRRSQGNAAKRGRLIDLRAKSGMYEVIKAMIKAEMATRGERT